MTRCRPQKRARGSPPVCPYDALDPRRYLLAVVVREQGHGLSASHRQDEEPLRDSASPTSRSTRRKSYARTAKAGGAGSLYVDEAHATALNQTPDFPDAFKPLAAAMQKALEELRQRDDVRWTYLSPAADFQAEGERTGTYQLGGEELMAGSQGPVISYADYAIAMVDLAESGEHVGERVSVVRP